jgi:hypothetical protein
MCAETILFQHLTLLTSQAVSPFDSARARQVLVKSSLIRIARATAGIETCTFPFNGSGREMGTCKVANSILVIVKV